MNKLLIITMGMVLLMGLAIAATQISEAISLDKLKKDKLKDTGINEPIISSCLEVDEFSCISNIYEKGGINKKIKIKTKYCDEYVLEQIDDKCSTYQNNTEEQCHEELVYENVCRDVTTQDCSWKPFDKLWGYTCKDVVENVCGDEPAQTCDPYFEEQCYYEDVYDEVCGEVPAEDICEITQNITYENQTIGNETVEVEVIQNKTTCVPSTKIECNDVLNEYKSKTCEDVEIANCTNTYSSVCSDVVVSQTCVEYEENLVSTGECSKWKTLSKSEIEDELVNKSIEILNNIANTQKSRDKVKEALTDEILVEIRE